MFKEAKDNNNEDWKWS